MVDCACPSADAKDCLAMRYTGGPVPFGDRHDAEECSCACHDELWDENGDDGRYQNGPYHGTEF
jgi:hypothetical protein